MAKRLFLADYITLDATRKRALLVDMKNRELLTERPNIIKHVTSSELGGSIYLLDVTQAVGDLIAAQPGVIEIPLNVLNNDISTLSGNQIVNNLITRIGYDFTQSTVRTHLYALIGYILINGGGGSFD